MKKIVLFLVISIPVLVVAQEQDDEVQRFIEISMDLKERRELDSLKLYTDSLFQASRNVNQKGLATAYHLKAMLSFNSENHIDSAIYFSRKALDFFEEIKDEENILLNALNYSIFLSHRGDMEEAFTVLFDMIRKADNSPNESLRLHFLRSAYNHLSSMQVDKGDFDAAIKYAELGLDLFTDDIQVEDNDLLAQLLGNASYAYIEKKQYLKSLELSHRCLELLEQDPNVDLHVLAGVYHLIGKSHFFLNRIEQAFKNLEKSLAISRSSEDPYFILFTLELLSKISLEKRQLVQARLYSEELIQIAGKVGFTPLIQNGHFGLYEIAKTKGAYQEALEQLEQYNLLKDSLFTEAKNQQISELEALYETERQQKEIEVINRQLGEETVLRNTFVAGFLLVFIVGVFIYRSERMKAKLNKELAIKNKHIAKTEELKSRWFVNISHELRTPLTLIQGPLKKVLTENTVNPVGKQDLQLASRNVEYLTGLVEEILDLSRLEEGKFELKKEVVSFSNLVKSTVANFDSIAKQGKVTLSCEIADDFYAELDDSKIRKLLINLISNALKHTGEGGSVSVRVSPNSENIETTISDTGEGISDTDLPRIFDRFFQTSDPSKSRQGGTGIGLSLAKEIALLHGGDLFAESQLKNGSVFTLTLPADLMGEAVPAVLPEPFNESEESDVKEKAPFLSKLKEKPTILLAEDNEDMRKYLQSLLKLNYQIVEAVDGKDALEKIKTITPDLLISDVMMPRMDGITLAREIRSSEKWKFLPLIMLTALDSEEDRLYTLKIGIDDYIHKPFNAEELEARISNLIQNSINRSTEVVTDELSYSEKTLALVELEVKKNLTESFLSVSYLADKVAMSERNLLRYLKKMTGLTPVQFIQEIKLQHARQLLERKTHATLKEVTHAVGMERTSYFSTLFERRFGIKPKEFL